ncbi:MAG: amidohydrolase [Aeromicrobium sp.]|nr:amidohydrolase [Aeromicrobium sp.]
MLHGARIWADGAWAGSFLTVTDGRIGVLGEGDHRSYVGPSTEIRDLGGAWVLPGFQDAHVHPVQAGTEMNACDLSPGHDADSYVGLVARYAAAHLDVHWILGGGWSMEAFPGGTPTADRLDAVVADRPVYLPNRDHHSAWVSSAALELAGISAATPDPVDGRIERDGSGRPTGTLHEGAMDLVGRLVPAPTDEQLMLGLLTAQEHLHSLGITGWQDALVGTGLGMADTLETYLAAAGVGRLTAKVVGALWWDRERGVEQVPELLARRDAARTGRFQATSVKIMQDGVCETYTAAMIDPYLDRHGHATDNHGLSFIAAPDLAAYVTALDAHDFQVHVHALGDRAVRDSLDAVQRAIARNGRRGNRHHLAHVQVVAAEDVPRFAALDVTVNAQPLWACRDDQMDDLTLPFLSPPARRQQYVFRSLIDAGARIVFGSDWPVSSPDPFAGMHVAVNRIAPGDGRGPLLAEQAMTVPEAIDAYTAGSSWINGSEASTGTIRPGHAADLAVIDRDVLAIDPTEIVDVQVLQTWVDGVQVFGR